MVAVTWVDSFTGRTLDLQALGSVCCQAGTFLVVNASQALGARPISVRSTPVDAVVSCGYKWLCSPYATGFAWLSPGLMDRLRPQQAYWLAMQAGRGLDQMRQTAIRDDVGVHAFDVFCPASFATALPWIASLELLLDTGIETIAAWDQQLAEHMVAGLDDERIRLISPANGASRVDAGGPVPCRRHQSAMSPATRRRRNRRGVPGGQHPPVASSFQHSRAG